MNSWGVEPEREHSLAPCPALLPGDGLAGLLGGDFGSAEKLPR